MHAKTRRREVGVAVDDTFHPVAKHRRTEIEKQPQGLLGEPQIGQQLFAMDRRELLDRFDFDNQRIFDDQVGAECVGKNEAAVLDADRLLADLPAALL